MRELVILPGEEPVYLLKEDGDVVEIHRDDRRDRTDAIYIGKVDRIAANLKAAFVDIGTDKEAFLPLEENSSSFSGTPLKSGMKIPVQIKREAHGGKGAFLSRDLIVAGSSLILMPMNRHIGISAKIEDEGKRKLLSEIGRKLCEDHYGLVIRTCASQMTEAELKAEFDRLKNKWNEIEQQLNHSTSVGPISGGESYAQACLRDYANGGINRVVTSHPEMGPEGIDTKTEDEDVLREQIRSVVRQALRRMVKLKHGGTIVIDPCEAMTVIDVNTASDTGNGEHHKTFMQTNLEACEEIARQIRLRNLSGIILIDMIDMDTQAEREQIIEHLTETVKKDRVKTVVHGMTDLGLIEMTRKRTSPSVYEQWTVSCEMCEGKGFRINGGKMEHGMD